MGLRAAAVVALLAGAAAACGGEDVSPGETPEPSRTTAASAPGGRTGEPGGATPRAGTERPAREPAAAYTARLEGVLGGSPDSVRDVLGDPDSIRIDVVRNRHEPSYRDASLTFFYPGVTADVYYVARSGREILSRLSVTAPHRTRPLPVGVGDPLSTVTGHLGPPGEIEGDTVRYSFGVAERTLAFRAPGDTVAEVTVHYYVD